MVNANVWLVVGQQASPLRSFGMHDTQDSAEQAIRDARDCKDDGQGSDWGDLFAVQYAPVA